MEHSGDGIPGESAKRVLNPDQFTDYAKDSLAQFEAAVTTTLPNIKEILRAKHVGAFVFGSAAIGVATNHIQTDRRVIPQSDVDACIVYESTRPSHLYTVNQLVQNDQTKNYALQDTLQPHCPDINVHSAIPSDAIKNVLNNLKEGNIASYADTSADRFFLYTLVNILLTRHAGDEAFIQDVQKGIISQLQSFGESGEKIWEQMNIIFKEEYVRYGDNSEFHPSTVKRQHRLRTAVSEIIANRNIPQEKIGLVEEVLQRQKERIHLPPLQEAHTLL